MADVPDAKDLEIARLRRGVSDLAALVALPASWPKNPAEIARSLGEALASMLAPDFVYVEIADGPGAPSGHLAHATGDFASIDPGMLGRELRRAFGEDPATWPSFPPRTALFGVDVFVAPIPLDAKGEHGAIVIGTIDSAFPTDMARLILNVARNQALLACRDAQALKEQRLGAATVLEAEVAERRRAEAALRASELAAGSLIDGIPGLAAILDPGGGVQHVNREILEYFGQTHDELRNWGTNGTIYPDDLPDLAQSFGDAISSGTAYDLEHRMRRADGEYRWFSNRGRPIRDAAGDILAWHVLLTEIDDRKRAEEAVRASERHLRQQTETFPQMLWSATAEGNIDYCNERLLEYSGLDADTVRDGGWVNLLHPDDREPTAEIWMRCIATGDPYSVEVRHFHIADQTYRWILTMALPLRDAEGRIVKWYGSCVDIHDRKLAEEALRASERHLAQVIDTIPAYVWSAGADGDTDFYNRRYLEYLGVPSEEVEGWKWTSIIHPDDLEGQLDTWKRAIETGEPYESQTRVRRFDGTYRWFLTRTSCLKDGDGQIKWFGASIDIEDMKQAEERLRESELNLRRLTETIPQNLFGAGTDGLVNYLNPQMRDWFGRAEDTIMAEEWVHLVHPEDRDSTVEAWTNAVVAGKPYRHQTRFLHRDGEYHWCDNQAQPLRDRDGTITGWYGVVNDIHDRKLAEDALKASEQNLRLTIDSIPAQAWSARADGGADFFNGHYLDYVGLPLDQMLDWQWTANVHPDDLDAILQEWATSRSGSVVGSVEARVKRHDGAYRWLAFHAQPFRNDAGEVVKWFGVNIDVDDRKRAALMLAGEKQLLELIAAGGSLRDLLAALCVIVEGVMPDCRCEVRLLDGSGSAFELGVAPSLPDEFHDFVTGRAVHEDLAPCGMAAVRNAQIIAEDIEADPRWHGSAARSELLKAGLRSVWSTPISSKAKTVLGTLCIYHDHAAAPQPDHQDIIGRVAHIASIAIERSRAEDELKRREYLLATAERISETGSFYWDLVNNKLVWSEQMHRIWEVDTSAELSSPNLLPVVHPDDRPYVEEKIARIFRGEDNPPNEERIVMPDGRIKWLNTSTLVFHYEDGRLECVGVAQDITRRKYAEDALDKVRSELAHVTRVMSLGELAASIAHEVNQPLAGIITNASTCLRMLAADPPDIEGAVRTAQRSIRDGSRASEVIRRLRSLYRRQDFIPESFNLNEAAQEVIAICAHDMQRRGVSLKADLDPALPPVVGDRIQLQQVILNLVLNAADALGSIKGQPRQIFVESATVEPGIAQFLVRDTGIGIAADDLGRIFDAFFTTKSNGMGIGLSVSKSIVDRHGGKLWVTPNDGPGTTFAFSIPYTQDTASPPGTEAIRPREVQGR